jgi:DNA-binding response OmpR family regulator
MPDPSPTILLLAEDDAALRGLIARSLRRQGYDVLEASDGQELLVLAQGLEPPPALVVSDVQMPLFSGPQALAELRAGGLECPLILITAFGGAEARAAADTLGACVVMEKPVDLAALEAQVRRMLSS